MGTKIDFGISQVQFFPDIIAMGGNRVGRCVENIRYFFCPLSPSDQIGNLNFLGGETLMGR